MEKFIQARSGIVAKHEMHPEQIARVVIGRVLGKACAQRGGIGRTFQRTREIELRARAPGFGVFGKIRR